MAFEVNIEQGVKHNTSDDPKIQESPKGEPPEPRISKGGKLMTPEAVRRSRKSSMTDEDLALLKKLNLSPRVIERMDEVESVEDLIRIRKEIDEEKG